MQVRARRTPSPPRECLQLRCQWVPTNRLGTQTSHHGGGGKAYLGIKLTLSHLSEAISIAESTRYKDSAALLATRMSLDRGVENAIEQIELLH